jgi:hypothetical protein
MADDRESTASSRKKAMGKAALVLGAAGLLLFIVGVKRRYRLDEERELELPRGPRAGRRLEPAEAQPRDEDEGDEHHLPDPPAPRRRSRARAQEESSAPRPSARRSSARSDDEAADDTPPARSRRRRSAPQRDAED